MSLFSDLKKWQAAKSRKKWDAEREKHEFRLAEARTNRKQPLYDSKWDDPVLEGMIRGNGSYLSASEPIRGRNSFESYPTPLEDQATVKEQLEYLEKMVREARSGVTVTY